MKRFAKTRKWIGLIALVLMLPACAATSKKFSSSIEADISVFADNTIAMLSETDLGFSKGIAIYTREFYALDEKEEQRYFNNLQEARKVLKGLVRYSIQLVTIAESYETPAERIDAYVTYLKQADDSVLEPLGLQKDHYDKLLIEVRSKTTFMDALRTAQPIINSLGRYMELTLTDMSENLDALVDKTDRKIDEEYADVIRYQEALEDEKYSILASLEEIYLSSKGDERAFARLMKRDILRLKSASAGGIPPYDELKAMTAELMNRLDRMHHIEKEIESDWTTYRATHRELDELHVKINADNRKMRLITLVWLRAHQKMASGAVNPAEWFDIKNAPAELFRLGSKAIF